LNLVAVMRAAASPADAMALPCSDTLALIQPYLDGELVERPLHDFESHVAACADCAESLRVQEVFSRHVRAGIRPPRHPDKLRDRIARALDAEDAARSRALRRARLVRFIPAAAAAAVSAAVTLWVATDSATRGGSSSPVAGPRSSEDPVCIADEPLDADRVARRASTYVGVPVALPRFHDARVSLRLLQVARVRDRRAAMLIYDVETPRARRLLWIYLFDARGLPPHGSGELRVVGGHRVWLTRHEGFPAVVHRSPRQVEYVFQANVSDRSLIELVAGSGL
jgi:hypothetical protein